MKYKQHENLAPSGREQPENVAHGLQWSSPAVSKVITTPQLNRSSMVAQPWERLKFFDKSADKENAADQAHDGDATETKSNQTTELYQWQSDGRSRRMILFGLTLFQTTAAGILMMDAMPGHGRSLMEILIGILFLVLFFWVSAGFWTAMAGFMVLLRGGDRHRVSSDTHEEHSHTHSQSMSSGSANVRTAIVMPICNEDVAQVYAGLRATYESLAKTPYAKNFDFFVLSDSDDTDICTAELDAWQTLCRAVNGFEHIFYRRRKYRVKRKSGNIADFCRRWGKNYRYMVVLDADSVMSGKCLTSLVNLMEANPDAGIIQTAPRMVGRDTLYARIQQFSTRAYGALYTAGLHYWQLGESHYWGHNAIIRINPFIRHCGLAPLPGKGALSGEILSHDFVEAALMRRAGWTVWIAYDLPGSYEETPPNFLDELQRDRRWCHGNMMNFRLILERGIHPVYRAVFATGLMAYLSSLLWLGFLILSTVLFAVQGNSAISHSPTFGIAGWIAPRSHHALQLFAVTIVLLMLPKLLAVARICIQGAKQFGGVSRLIVSMLLEMIFSALAAPTKMLFHSTFVVSAITGRLLHWKSPLRDNAETSWKDAYRWHGKHTLIGVVWAAIVCAINPACLLWLSPVIGALLLSIPLSVFSSRTTYGNRLRAMGLFMTPEESSPPAELCSVVAYRDNPHKLPGFIEAVVDPITNALMCAVGKSRSFFSSGATRDRLKLLHAALHKGPAGLSLPERKRLLNDPHTLFQLHLNVWESSLAHPQWRNLIANHELANK